MKKINFFVFLLSLLLPVLSLAAASETRASNSTALDDAQQGFHPGPYFDIGFLAQLAGGSNGSDILAGWGPGLGYAFDKNWAAQVELNTGTDVSNAALSYSFTRVLGELRFTFDSGNPYVLVGGGLDSESVGNSSQSYADLLGGLGLQAELFSFLNTFLEAKFNCILTPGSITAGVPITAGIRMNF